jgi:hypothetical protein
MEDFFLDLPMGLLGAVPVEVFAILGHEDVDLPGAFSTGTTDTLELRTLASPRVIERRLGLAHQLDTLLRHIIDNDKVDLSDIKTLLANGGRYQDIVFAFFEVDNGLYTVSYDLICASKSPRTDLFLLLLVEPLIILLFPLRLTDEFGSLEQVRVIIQHILPSSATIL